MPSTSPAATPSPSGASHDSETGPELLGAPRRRRRGDARALGVELGALAQPGDQHAALAAAGRVLVGDGDLLEAALRLAEVDQALEPLVGEASPSKRPTTRVSAAVSSGAPLRVVTRIRLTRRPS